MPSGHSTSQLADPSSGAANPLGHLSQPDTRLSSPLLKVPGSQRPQVLPLPQKPALQVQLNLPLTFL